MAALSDETRQPGSQPEVPSGSTRRADADRRRGSGAPPPPPPGWTPAPAPEDPPATGRLRHRRGRRSTSARLPPDGRRGGQPTSPPPRSRTAGRCGSGSCSWCSVSRCSSARRFPACRSGCCGRSIIVAAGVIQAVTPGREGWNVNRLFDGLVSVAFGLVLLGNTTGRDRVERLVALHLAVAGPAHRGRHRHHRPGGGPALDRDHRLDPRDPGAGLRCGHDVRGLRRRLLDGSGQREALSYSAPVLDTTRAELQLTLLPVK